MKRLDQLGISPWRWSKAEYQTSDEIVSQIWDCNGRLVCDTLQYDYYQAHANNNMIRSAPDLYVALFDLVSYGSAVLDWDSAPEHIKTEFALRVKNAKHALEVASGEEVAP